MYWKTIVIIAILVGLSACGDSTPKQPTTPPPSPSPQPVAVTVPDFAADSAFWYIQQQVAFGPRVPGTDAHDRTRQYLVNKMSRWAGAGNVIQQQGRARLYDGTAVNFTNIITAIHPEATQRVLLMAHWDTRKVADHDPNEDKRDMPILGANDGGSGVGVLMEIARQMEQLPLENIGVDIIFFDAEDQGLPDNMGYARSSGDFQSWCLGSQYWSKNRHRTNANYRFGILLDMVGAADATFPKEGYSRQYAPRLVDRIWQQAREMGYSNYFIPQNGKAILDDHYFINTIANIPTVDIIHYDPNTGRFDESWHTHADDMAVIDPKVLRAVGEVVLHVIYEEDAKSAPL